jgi:cytidylate kinase
MVRPNILISGLTAAGKTTHAKLLAAELGYRYVSATEIIADMVGIDRNAVGPGFWKTHGEAIRKARDTTDLDRELDERLVTVASSDEGLVIDAWALPWLTTSGRCVSIWLESDLRSRTMKASVSDLNRRSLSWYSRFISSKDDDSRERFLALHGFDLYGPRENFHMELDNSDYICWPTRTDADRGIAGFRPVVGAALKDYFAGRRTGREDSES